MVVIGFLSVPFWEFGETWHDIARLKKKSKLNYSATDFGWRKNDCVKSKEGCIWVLR